MLDIKVIMIENCTANVNFDRFYFAEVWQKVSKTPLIWVLCRNKQKPFLPRIPLISTVKQHPIHWGFFTSAVSTTIDSLLKSAGCTEKIGCDSPRQASLAALITRLHNLFSLSGKIAKLRIEVIRSAHLVISSFKRYYGEGSNVYLIAP